MDLDTIEFTDGTTARLDAPEGMADQLVTTDAAGVHIVRRYSDGRPPGASLIPWTRVAKVNYRPAPTRAELDQARGRCEALSAELATVRHQLTAELETEHERVANLLSELEALYRADRQAGEVLDTIRAERDQARADIIRLRADRDAYAERLAELDQLQALRAEH